MKGFTLVETMVAIAVMMVAIIGPFVAIQRAVVDSYISRDELIGNSLAQEGVEYVRSIRDGNYLYNRATSGTRWWLYGLNGGAGIPDCVANSCVVDPLPQTVQACNGTNCSAYPLYITSAASPTPYVYTQASGSGNILSRFTRSIQLCYINELNGPSCTASVSNEARLTVTVTWITQGRTYTTLVTEYLQNWL
jgi:Tfp pilus assembly protein PilV